MAAHDPRTVVVPSHSQPSLLAPDVAARGTRPGGLVLPAVTVRRSTFPKRSPGRYTCRRRSHPLPRHAARGTTTDRRVLGVPADRSTLELVVAERRRRSRMRAVHLAPPDAVDARLAALAAGFDDAITSATPVSELVGRLAWLDARARPRDGSGAALPVADELELDLVAHELRRGDELIHLRPKEFGLLALLAAHPGRAYSRRELLDRVWGPDHHGGCGRSTSTSAGSARRSSRCPSAGPPGDGAGARVPPDGPQRYDLP